MSPLATDREVDEAGGGLGPQLGVADHGGEEEEVAGDGGDDDGQVEQEQEEQVVGGGRGHGLLGRAPGGVQAPGGVRQRVRRVGQQHALNHGGHRLHGHRVFHRK